MRLIDADALLTKRQKVTSYDEGGWSRDYLAVDVEDIKGAQTIDPVKHGHWERAIHLMTAYYFKCSICGDSRIIYPVDYPSMVYCPRCGSKLDEEVSE